MTPIRLDTISKTAEMTLNNYILYFCELVWSAILATAWLLVRCLSCFITTTR